LINGTISIRYFQIECSRKVLLVEAIWDSIANEKNQSYNLSDDQIKILEEELAAYNNNPNEGSSWEEVKNRITKK